MAVRFIALIAAGYLLGCISTGILVGKLTAGIDIRTKGSGNAGATNILRTLGWAPGVLTFVGDALKAIASCLLGWLLLRGYGEWYAGLGARLGGIACILGHNWPVFFGFRGGKGVSASFGLLLFTEPLLAGCVLVVFLIATVCTKTVSIGSVSAGLANIALTFLFYHGDWPYIVCGLVLTALLLICHRANIRRLFTRTENALDFESISKISKGGKNV